MWWALTKCRNASFEGHFRAKRQLLKESIEVVRMLTRSFLVEIMDNYLRMRPNLGVAVNDVMGKGCIGSA